MFGLKVIVSCDIYYALPRTHNFFLPYRLLFMEVEIKSTFHMGCSSLIKMRQWKLNLKNLCTTNSTRNTDKNALQEE